MNQGFQGHHKLNSSDSNRKWGLNDVNFSIPEFQGMQLYTGDEGTPTMSIGTMNTGSFQLTDDGLNGVAGAIYTLDVKAVPEPGTLLLLCSGLFAIGVGLRRRGVFAAAL